MPRTHTRKHTNGACDLLNLLKAAAWCNLKLNGTSTMPIFLISFDHNKRLNQPPTHTYAHTHELRIPTHHVACISIVRKCPCLCVFVCVSVSACVYCKFIHSFRFLIHYHWVAIDYHRTTLNVCARLPFHRYFAVLTCFQIAINLIRIHTRLHASQVD